MTPQEQEAAFKQLRKKYPTRSARWASGYVHGLQDAEIREDANVEYAREYNQCILRLKHRRQIGKYMYAIGYIEGFTKARGVDAETIVMEALHVV